MKVTEYFTKDQIDVEGKLSNMLDSEISADIYHECQEHLREIEDTVWELMTDPDRPFSDTEFYSHLSPRYEPTDFRDDLDANVYNCDLLYMIAIAIVLQLPIPEDSCDIHIFGL